MSLHILHRMFNCSIPFRSIARVFCRILRMVSLPSDRLSVGVHSVQRRTSMYELIVAKDLFSFIVTFTGSVRHLSVMQL